MSGWDRPVTAVKVAEKLIIFSLGDPSNTDQPSLYLGVQVQFVHKILNQTAVYSSGQTWAGVAHLGDREATIVDFHHLIYGTPLAKSSYLVVLKTPTGELLGVPVLESPSLADVPVKDIRVLPASYRQVDTLRMASHVAVVTTEDGPQTVFLLDPTQMIGFLTQPSPLISA
jgi:hypothetical protein